MPLSLVGEDFFDSSVEFAKMGTKKEKDFCTREVFLAINFKKPQRSQWHDAGALGPYSVILINFPLGFKKNISSGVKKIALENSLQKICF